MLECFILGCLAGRKVIPWENRSKLDGAPITRQERRALARAAAKEMFRNPPKKKYLWDVGALLLGLGATLMVTEVWPSMYWPGVVCFYLGAISLARHLAMDAELLPQNPLLRKALAAICLFGVSYFWSIKVVFVSAPMNEDSSAWIGNYPTGTVVGGILWQPFYADVRIDISNPSAYDYKDVDLFIAEDITIMAAGQITQIPGVSFFAEDSQAPFSSAQLGGEDMSGNPLTVPLPIPLDLSKPRGFRLVCDKLPRHSTVKIVLASVALNYGPPPLPKLLFAPKRLPREVKISGSYRALGRERDVAETKTF